MGFIIWYQVVIEEDQSADGLLAAAASFLGLGLPVKVSNDVFNGSFILDAEIKLEMSEGASADTFEVSLIDLPSDVVQKIESKQKDGLAQRPPAPLNVKIFLGYFDEITTKFEPVMVGALTSIESSVSEDGSLVTVVKGQEVGGYRLRTLTLCESRGKKGKVNVDQFVKDLAGRAKVDVPNDFGVNVTLEDFTLIAENGLGALRQIAEAASTPLIVRDKKILMGKSVGNEDAPDAFDEDTNLVKLERIQESRETRGVCDKSPAPKTESNTRISYKATVLGNPKLRVGQNVKLETKDVPKEKLRITQLSHAFSSKNGYICQVTLVLAKSGEPAEPTGGARGVVDRVSDFTKTALAERPAIDVGEVTEYTAGSQQQHLVALNYGQSPPTNAVVPSVEVDIDKDIQLHNKPIASPFAWHKCGLVVPVYPKMRAVLAHNRGLVNDAAVAGFLWSENPRYEPPKNEPGDYWLALPTELDSNGLPTGKGVNDLTDSSGLRVIQAKSLHILVGTDALPDIGVRPSVSDPDTIVIEHASGTKITVSSSGALKIETSNQEIALTNGSVTMKLNGSAVEVS